MVYCDFTYCIKNYSFYLSSQNSVFYFLGSRRKLYFIYHKNWITYSK